MIVLALALISLLMGVNGMNEFTLGRLTWCNTLCLCDKTTQDEVHCFSSRDIYGLVQIDERRMKKLERINYNLKELLFWCTDNCLCHNRGMEKEFKCGSPESMKTILTLAPHLTPYFENDTEISQPAFVNESKLQDETTEQNIKKKNRKNRKNKDKIPKEDNQLASIHSDMTGQSPNSDFHQIYNAGMIGYSPSSEQSESYMYSTSENVPKEIIAYLNKLKLGLEIIENHQNKQLEELNELRIVVSFNTFLIYITCFAITGLLLGFLILCIVMCCRKSSAKMKVKGPSEGKGNITEAW